MTKKRFRAILETEADGGHFIRVPFDVPKTFGARGRVAVRGILNGAAFRGALFPYGGVFYLGVNKIMRAAAKIAPGDSVKVEIERDAAPRVVKPPADLARALKANTSATAAWDKLSYARRKEYARAVTEAKKLETRAWRVTKTIEELTAK